MKEAIVIFDAFPDKELAATVKEIGTEASATTRTYPVTLAMEQPEGAKILPGMAGKATGKRPSEDVLRSLAVVVPTSAVFSRDSTNQSYVWVIDEASKSVKSRPVKTGKLTDLGIKIADGLKAGEWIATAGVHYLREGQKVRILAQ